MTYVPINKHDQYKVYLKFNYSTLTIPLEKLWRRFTIAIWQSDSKKMWLEIGYIVTNLSIVASNIGIVLVP